ncbi:MAG: tetratricopeptide repeat protein [Spirochaetia bacterium]|nr:tetratricopeptide repeat protein [Spirochaetia bacterium]
MSVEICSHLAEYYFGTDLIDAALKEWQDLAQKFPFNSDAHLGIGRSYMALQRFDRALLSLRRALDLAPEDPEVYKYLEQLYEMKNNKNEYLDLLEHRLLRDRYNPQLLQAAAGAARDQGRDELAEEYLQRAEDLQ